MQAEGEFDIRVPIQEVWDSLWNSETLPIWVPGCTQASLDGRNVRAVVEQSVAFLKARFELDVAVAEADPPHRVAFEGGGKDPKIASQVKMTMKLDLAEAAAEVTHVRFRSDFQVFGRIATIGQFVIQLKAKEIEKELIQKVRATLEKGAA